MTGNQLDLTAVEKNKIHVETVELQSPSALTQSQTQKGPTASDLVACFLFGAAPTDLGTHPS